MKNLIQLVVALALVVNPLSTLAASTAPKLGHPDVVKIIEKAYQTQMDKTFIAIMNASRKNPKAKDFLLKLVSIPKEHPDYKYFVDTLGESPSPKILSISNGLRVSMGDKSMDVQLAGKLGVLNIDGKPAKVEDGRNLRKKIEAISKTSAYSPVDFILPKAEAAVIVPVLWAAVSALVRFAAVGAAVGAGSGAVLGCGVGIHGKAEEQTYLQGCADGAEFGAMYGAGLGAFVMGPSGAYAYGWEAIEDLDERERAAFAAKFKALLKGVGVLGTVIGVVHGADQILHMNGVEIDCRENGKYAVTGMYSGSRKELYFYNGAEIALPSENRFGWTGFQPTSESIHGQLTKSGMTTQEAVAVSESIIAEHNGFVEACKGSPGKVIRRMSSDVKELKPKEASSIR